MSTPYDHIPPERRAQYLANAEAAFNEAILPIVDPAIEWMGSIAAKAFDDLNRQDANAGELVSEAEAYLQSDPTAAGAEQHLEDHNRHWVDNVIARIDYEAHSSDESERLDQVPEQAGDILELPSERVGTPQQPRPDELRNEMWGAMEHANTLAQYRSLPHSHDGQQK